ncbi:uncharacterized protein BP5553_04499 [Venustampulla echinocandica]|uniref:Rhodopsin domain-containing protein n=1 Tax=Venustampulla echinocandica TaxID=2656787 RepID=A0A370TNG0_9HELO|nr:uncharacterized protein BP5553_04499 [Venustampulla echinocandica]RDL37066.1 hypothetical protein BP5553_04499 [Venustampulla echinocandica]
MPWRQKISLLVVVCLGILVIISTGVRLQQSLSFNLSSDLSWNASSITTWTSIEINVALFCSSVTAIRPLIRQLMPGLMASMSGTHRSGNHTNVYASGMSAQKSYRGQGNGFELQSATDIELPVQGNTSIWSKNEPLEDDDSGKAVLGEGGSMGRGEIRKTVSVTITDSKAKDNVSGHNNNSRFEPL